MSKFPWFPFYPSDWLNGTADMTLEQVGAYIQITALLYDNDNALALDRIEHPVTGKLQKYSYKRIARRLNTRSDKIQRIVDGLVKQNKLSIQAGFLTSYRVAREIAKRRKKSKSSRDAAKKRWQERREKQCNYRRM